MKDLGGQLARGGDGDFTLPAALSIGGPLRGGGAWNIQGIRRLDFDLPGATAGAIGDFLEGRMKYGPGLYRCMAPGDLAPLDPGSIPTGDEVLLFIHGTMSSTEGSFGELPGGPTWQRLQERYPDRIFAFEHHTLSRSPIQNAIELLDQLPADTRLHLVTHSRGGLVGELLCRGLREGGPPFDDRDLTLFRQWEGEGSREADLEALERLGALMQAKRPRVERFARVACPASGTTLASGRLDRYLSILRNLIGLIPALKDNPIYELTTAFLLSVVKQRTRPQALPGLEAQMPESPFIAMVNRPDLQLGADLSVVAGDVEPAGVFKRLAVLAADAFFLDQHDFVVHTPAMLGGARRTSGGRAYLSKGSDVNHFRYFQNEDTAEAIDRALRGDTEEGFVPLVEARGAAPRERRAEERAVTVIRPVVFIVPGLMGSHLKVDGDRVWLDLADLALGGMSRLKREAEGVEPLRVIDRVYGDLSDFLSDTHEVRHFPYDWRDSLLEWGDRFGQEVKKALDRSRLPVRIVAHSMGGLVTQAMIHQRPDVWREFTRRPGHRVVLMGTPIRGSFSIPLVFLGREQILRKLAMLDITQSRRSILKIVSRYQGLLELLPDLEDFRLFDPAAWDEWHRLHGGWSRPEPEHLAAAMEVRTRLAEISFGESPVLYVAGWAPATAAGYRLDPKAKGEDRIRFLATTRGDGRVTWETGPPEGSQVYYLLVEHGDLPAHRPAFRAFLELLVEGDTQRLPRTPPVSRAAEVTFELPTIPVDIFPDDVDLEAAAVGGSRRVTVEARPAPLRVRVAHGNLAFASHPVMVGHYEGDLIVSAEEQLDHHLGGRLSQRHAVGIYPGRIRSAEVILNPVPGQRPRGGIIVGLGAAGRLSPGALNTAITHAILEYAAAVRDRSTGEEVPGARRGEGEKEGELAVSSLFIGTGEGGITLQEALEAMVQGVQEANRILAEEGAAKGWCVADLEFVELYEDRAIQALDIARKMEEEAESGSLSVAGELSTLPGGRRRIYPWEDERWWHRVQILGGEQVDEEVGVRTGAEPSRDAKKDARAPGRAEELSEGGATSEPEAGGGLADPTTRDASRWEYPEYSSLRFQALTDRARVSRSVVPTQRLLVDEMVRDSIGSTTWDRELAATMFELLLPNDFKERAADERSVELVVDEEAARYPWELLVDPKGDGTPISVRAGIVRRLITPASRENVQGAAGDFALVVGNPRIGLADLPDLPGATAEAREVSSLLEQSFGFSVASCIETTHTQVLKALFGKGEGAAQGFRVLHLAGHGLYGGRKGKPSGMVIGPRALLGPAEVERLRQVPDLVFINCCHLGFVEGRSRLGERRANELAANLGLEFTRMGVRAIIAAGWAVNDAAAVLFAKEFYRQMLENNEAFGEAVTKARNRCYEEYGDLNNTWGAYQCYGDHSFRLRPQARAPYAPRYRFSSPRQATVELENVASDAQTASAYGLDALDTKLRAIEAAIPTAWKGRRADLVAALGMAHGQLGHFEEASRHLAEAMKSERANYRVRHLETLANFMARHAFLEWADNALEVPAARRRIEEALALLDRLSALSATSERLSLRGSAHKRLATIVTGKARAQSLDLAHDAYREAFKGLEKAGNRDPYPLHNWLSCMVLLKWREGGRRLGPTFRKYLALAQREARERDARDPSFFNHMLRAEVLLIEHLWDGTLDLHRDEIVDRFRGAWRRGGSIRSLNSVREHMQCLARILETDPSSGREAANRMQLARTLDEIRARFSQVVDEQQSP